MSMIEINILIILLYSLFPVRYAYQDMIVEQKVNNKAWMIRALFIFWNRVN